MSTWRIYTEICTWVVLFSLGSGVYLMAVSQKERRSGWTVLISASLLSAVLFIYVLVVG